MAESGVKLNTAVGYAASLEAVYHISHCDIHIPARCYNYSCVCGDISSSSIVWITVFCLVAGHYITCVLLVCGQCMFTLFTLHVYAIMNLCTSQY